MFKPIGDAYVYVFIPLIPRLIKGKGKGVSGALDKHSCDRKSRSASSVSIHNINIVCIQKTWIQGYRVTLRLQNT